MSLTTLIASKEGNYSPCLLGTFTFPDGSTLRVSTHNFNTAEGGNQYGGVDWLARIDQQDIGQIQARSEQGVDRISEVTVHLYDADKYLSLNYEMASGKGFKGAILKLALILMDIDPATGNYVFSTDSTAPLKFLGVCDAANSEQGGAVLTIRATTSHNLAKVDFPILHVQQRCINVFPRNADERLAGATDISSWQWGCGYNPDRAGTDPEIGGDCRRGNTTTAGATDAQGRVIADGSGNYILCNYTKADCVARGMYTVDSTPRATGRFTAIQWAPLRHEQQSIKYKAGPITVYSSRNDSIYDRSYPMLYGTQWVKRPIVANILGDGNSTRFEVVVSSGDIGPTGINKVVVNGVLIPTLGSGGLAPALGGSGPDPLFRWNFLDQKTLTSTHTGSRNGYVNTDSGWNAGGDPYGSLATIEVVVYADLAQSNSVPDAKVWANGPKLATYSPGFALARTTNPAWVVYDMLVWANYSYSELDTASFIAAAAICDASVTYTDLTGSSKSHARFICQFVLEDRRKANEVLQAVLRSFNAQLVPNSETGLLQLFVRQGLFDQQPAPISGSNYNTGISSYKATDTSSPTGTGYAAYLIDESVIQQDGAGNPKIRGPYCAPNAQAANRITIPFQDSDNQYADDSITVVDPDDVSRAAGYQLGGNVIDAGITVLGISNFDQGIRVANVILAENLRGNEIGDTRGTRFFDVETTHRLEHLRVGQLVLFSYQQLGLSHQLMRVEAIKPVTDYRRMTVTLRWHQDIWYTDAYGQHPAPLYSDPNKSLPNRLPYAWHPFAEQPISGDSIWDRTEWGFAITQSYPASVPTLTVSGNPPLNQPSSDVQPPLMTTQGGTANTGGTIPGGIRLHGAIAAKDSSGKWSLLSNSFFVDIPTGTNTNTLVTPTINWQSGTAGWALFVGLSEQTWSLQNAGTGTPSTVTITGLDVSTGGPPDILADSLLFRVKHVIHGGVWGDACTAVTTNGDGTGFITFATATTNGQFAGYDLTKLANPQGDESNVVIADFHVIGNTGGVYHVSPDPFGVVAAGDVFEMRTLPSTHTSTTIGDANFVNAYAAGGLTANAEVNNLVRIIAGTGRGQVRAIISNTTTVLTVDTAWDTTPDATSRFIIEDPTWQNEPLAKVSASALNASPAPQVASFSIADYRGSTILIQALVQDAQGNRSIERFSPLREVYLWGAAGDGYFTVTPVAGNVTIDLANGLNQRLVLSGTAVTILAPIFTGGSIVAGSWFALYIDQDVTGSRVPPTYTGGAGGFAADDGLTQVDGTPSGRTALQFTFHGSVWGLDSLRLGVATS